MSELLTIEASLRTVTGKEYAKKLRRDGKVPAVLLEKGKATSLELSPKLLPKIYKHGRKFLMNLGGVTRPVLIKDLQIDPVKRLALHLDLVYVD
jgi:large subunit ribosomal protein L25